mgnify:CR=1 FL=1
MIGIESMLLLLLWKDRWLVTEAVVHSTGIPVTVSLAPAVPVVSPHNAVRHALVGPSANYRGSCILRCCRCCCRWWRHCRFI